MLAGRSAVDRGVLYVEEARAGDGDGVNDRAAVDIDGEDDDNDSSLGREHDHITPVMQSMNAFMVGPGLARVQIKFLKGSPFKEQVKS